MSRRWDSGPGGLYASLILRNRKIPPSRLGALSLWTAQAAATAIRRGSGLTVVVKPPNDVLAHDPRRPGSPPKKVCGVLIEARGDSRRLDWIVIGVGLNVRNRIPEHVATRASSLGLLSSRSREPDVAGMLRLFLAEFWPFYRKLV